MEVYVVIHTDDGWDNINGIYDKSCVTEQQLKNRFPPEDGWIVIGYHRVINMIQED